MGAAGELALAGVFTSSGWLEEFTGVVAGGVWEVLRGWRANILSVALSGFRHLRGDKRHQTLHGGPYAEEPCKLLLEGAQMKPLAMHSALEGKEDMCVCLCD